MNSRRARISFPFYPACFAYLGACVVALPFFSACGRNGQHAGDAHHQASAAHGVPSGWRFSLPRGDKMEGRRLFVEMGCAGCHEIKGEDLPRFASGEPGVGPELSQMAYHPPEFLAESIINPNAMIEPEDKKLGYIAEDGKSRMPDYGDILTVRQLVDLVAYLASLKHGKD